MHIFSRILFVLVVFLIGWFLIIPSVKELMEENQKEEKEEN